MIKMYITADEAAEILESQKDMPIKSFVDLTVS